MRIFMTGATGVIGRRVVPALVAAGHEVTAAGRSPEKRAQLERMGAAAVEASLFDVDALSRALRGHDVVINLATHIPEGMRMFMPGGWRENDRVRRIGSANLVSAAIANGVAQFVQESFAPVFPDSGDRWIDESTPVHPSRYNRTVADAERSVARFAGHGGAGVVLRFAPFYGPDSPQTRQLGAAIERGWVPIPGSPQSFTSSVSHDDAASAVVAALGARAGTYNVADDEPLRRREYYDLLAEALGVGHPRFLPPWAALLYGSLGEMLARSLRISNRKLREGTGWAPRYPSVREGWPALAAELAAGDARHLQQVSPG